MSNINKEKDILNTEKIDLVYSWVDSSDIEWQKKKQNYEQNYDLSTGANDKSRFVDNDELKYSLRSVEKYMPWINHIYIITDNQKPEWLNLDNPKISVVDHKEIIPKQVLPIFNSQSIEHCMVNIPNLSEKFLYANDDMFVCSQVTPDFFFVNGDKPIYRASRNITQPNKNIHTDSLINAERLIYKKYRKKYKNYSHHNIDPYKKSEIKACYEEFKDEIDKTISHRFRTSEDIPRFIYHYYACVNNRGRYKILHKIDRDLPIYRYIFFLMTKRYQKDSVLIRLININNAEMILEKFKPKLFCINDDRFAQDNDRENLHQFLNKMFPQKSEYEK